MTAVIKAFLKHFAKTVRPNLYFAAPSFCKRIPGQSTLLSGPNLYLTRCLASAQQKSYEISDQTDDEKQTKKKKEGVRKVVIIKNRYGEGRISVRQIDVDTSIAYMQSKAFKTTYKGQPVWLPYRRNTKGPFPKEKTRRTCIRNGKLSAGNPCPICRDDHLVVHRRNTELLKQFMDPSTGEIRETKQTNVCRRQQRRLQVALMEAYDHGDLPMSVPFREYDYSRYYKTYKKREGRQDDVIHDDLLDKERESMQDSTQESQTVP